MVTERRRVRLFTQGLNLEIQEALAAVQVNTFTEALDKVQRIENAKAQVKAFHARKRSASSSTHEELRENATPPTVKRVNHSPYPPWTLGKLEEGSTRESQVEKGQQEEIPREGQKVAPRLACGYCGKTNHTENDCLRKEQKFLVCGSTDHQISNCPKKQQRGNNAQQGNKTTPRQANDRGNRTRVPAQVYIIDKQQTLESSKAMESKKKKKISRTKFS